MPDQPRPVASRALSEGAPPTPRPTRLSLSIPLLAVGVCCATTIAGTTLGAGVLAAAAGALAGLGWLAIPLAGGAAIIAVLARRSRDANRAR